MKPSETELYAMKTLTHVHGSYNLQAAAYRLSFCSLFFYKLNDLHHSWKTTKSGRTFGFLEVASLE